MTVVGRGNEKKI